MQNNNKTQLKRAATTLALSAVMAALVAISTFLIQFPVPATGGYIDIGDVMIFISALTFGPIVGGIAGGIGSFISDTVSGYLLYAPFTLIIKGLEGTISGSISNQKNIWRDVIAVTVAGVEMVGGYFLAEFFPLHIGWAALIEVPGNITQIVVGAAIGIPVSLILRRRLPAAWRKN